MHYVYAHKELFDGVPRTDFAAQSGNIVIYGAGFQGLLSAFLLKKQGVKVTCFADRDQEKRKKPYFGLPVISPEEMYSNYRNALIIVTPYVLEPIYRTFIKDGLNAVTPYSLFLDFESDDFDSLPEIPEWYRPESLDFNVDMFLRRCNNLIGKQYVGMFDLSVSQKCTLRCRECTSLMPYYEKPRDYSLEEVLDYCEKVLKNRLFHHIYLEGGEPFIWKDMPILLNRLVQREELFNVTLITNGTVVPSEKLMEALQNPKVLIRISDYGNQSREKENLIRIFDERGIRYKVQLQKWSKMSEFYPKSDEEYRDNISSCCKLGDNGTPHIADGKMFVCPIQANLHNTGIFVSSPADYIDLRQEDNETMQAKIDVFLRAKHIPEVCRYCNGRGYSSVIVPPAEQLAPGEKMQVVFRREP